MITKQEKIQYLKNKFKDNNFYYENASYFNADFFFVVLESKINEHLQKIETIDIFDIKKFVGAHNYDSLLIDYKQDIKERLDHYVKFLTYVYNNIVNYGVNTSNNLEIIDIYNIKYNQMIQQEPCPDGFGISLYYNRN